jgi:hypothetical protein
VGVFFFDRLPYTPDFTPSDYLQFTYLKNWLGSQCSKSNEELMEGVKTWFSSQTADVFDTGIQNLIPQCDKFLNLGIETLRSGLSMYVFFVNNICFLIYLFC